MKVLVLGESGQLATHLRKLLPGAAYWGRAKLDLGTSATIRAAIESHRPTVIVNAAAYTAVDKAEAERDVAWSVNAEAAAMVARASRAPVSAPPATGPRVRRAWSPWGSTGRQRRLSMGSLSS